MNVVKNGLQREIINPKFRMFYNISIFHVVLVWMGKSIPRAKDSKGGDEAAPRNTSKDTFFMHI